MASAVPSGVGSSHTRLPMRYSGTSTKPKSTRRFESLSSYVEPAALASASAFSYGFASNSPVGAPPSVAVKDRETER